MNLRKKLLRQSRLYAILDKQTLGSRSLVSAARALAAGGADIIQLRDKKSPKEVVFREACAVGKVLKGTRVLFIVNDHCDIAGVVGCDGVHLGQDDYPVETARRVLGGGKIIGVSCHSLKQALRAQEQGADYIGIGPIFSTPTKPEYKPIGTGVLRRLSGVLKIPFFAIGNINCENARQVRSCGAECVAVCRDFIAHKNIRAAVRAFKVQVIGGRL